MDNSRTLQPCRSPSAFSSSRLLPPRLDDTFAVPAVTPSLNGFFFSRGFVASYALNTAIIILHSFDERRVPVHLDNQELAEDSERIYNCGYGQNIRLAHACHSCDNACHQRSVHVDFTPSMAPSS